MPNARVLMATAGMLVVRVKPVDPDNWEDGVWPLRMAYLSQNAAVFNVSIHTQNVTPAAKIASLAIVFLLIGCRTPFPCDQRHVVTDQIEL